MNERLPVGFILLIVGGVLLAREVGVPMPRWLFTWEMLLVTIGFTIGVANRFRDFGWLIVTGIGLFFLMDDVYPEVRQFVWPAIIIILGLIIILKPSKHKNYMIQTTITSDGPPGREQAPFTNTPALQATDSKKAKEDVLDLVAVFGAVKKVVFSKNFRGGEVVCVFGGSEINLTQADFEGIVKLEIVAIFGGAKLIVPANWQIRSEAAAILGGIDDKRDPAVSANSDKVLVLDGAAICGGIEISNF